jgi:D-lactate dehydrogenase
MPIRIVFESSGCASKLAVFAARSIPSRRKNASGSFTSAASASGADGNPSPYPRRFEHLPVALAVSHRDIYDIAERYGKDTFLMIDKLGTDKMPFFFTMKGRADAMLEKVSLFKHFTLPTAAKAPDTSSRRTPEDEKLAR